MEIEFPRKLAFLFEPHPNKVAHGGRDGVKSWSFATALTQLSSNLHYWRDMGRENLRVLCARETQKSITASVHQLLRDTIERLNLTDRFEIHDHYIRCVNGGTFIFTGLKHNPAGIKSAEGVDIVWVEEANQVSKDSWSKLLPTIRKPGAEVWVSFNPELDTDDTYVRWVVNPVPGTIRVETGWQDNRWLSERSRVAIEHMRQNDPDEYDHVYGGKPLSSVRGAIFAQELKKASDEGRISVVPYNRTRPVHTIWDLGFGDMTTIWFVQLYDGFYNFIDYAQGSGQTIANYLILLQDKKYLYGTDWLPHDGVDSIIHKKLGGGSPNSIEQLMRNAGREVRIVPKVHVVDRINAGRTIFPQCRFDKEKCSDGLQALRHYQWGELTDREKELRIGKKEPLHNWASHGADAFTEAGVARMDQPKAPEPPKAAPPPRGQQGYSPFG